MKLEWYKQDIEGRLGFAGGKYSGVNALLAFFIGAVFFAVFYTIVFAMLEFADVRTAAMFFHGGEQNRSVIPYFIVFFSCWSLAILLLKNQKLGLQRKAVKLKIVPDDPDFILTPGSAANVLRTLYASVDDPRRFMVLNRIERALANLKNIGRVSDVAEGLSVQAENDEAYIESTYTLLRGFIWAVPVMGFIGTVVGLSQAIGEFGKVVAAGAGVAELTSSLGGVTSGLSIAFETTMVGLIAALIVQLLATMIRKKEEDFMDECSDYCHRYVIAKLKTLQERQVFMGADEGNAE